MSENPIAPWTAAHPKSVIAMILTPIILVIVVAISSAIYDAKYPAKLKITVAPASATVEIGGTRKNGGTHSVVPGEYTIVVSKDGFESQSHTVTAEAGVVKDVQIALIPNSEETANWYLEHPEDERIATGIASAQYEESTADFVADYPAVEHLPYIHPSDYYRIDYGTCTQSSTDICLFIEGKIGHRTSALEYFNKNIGESGQYHFSFTDFANVFGDSPLSVPPTADENTIRTALEAYASQVPHATISSFSISSEKYCTFTIDVKKADYYLLADRYRGILAKDTDGWKVVAQPELSLEYNKYPDLPQDLIKNLNELYR